MSLDLSDLKALSASDAELSEIASLLSGDFHSLAQAERDLANEAKHPHFQVLMHIAPVKIDGLSNYGYAFYLEQAIDGYTDQPYRQRVYLVARSTEDKALNRIFDIADPGEFVGGWKDPEKLTGLTKERLREAKGCDVSWTRIAAGHYSGVAGADRSCLTSRNGATHIMVAIDLTDGLLKALDQGYDDNETLIFGPSSEEGPYEFVRQTSLNQITLNQTILTQPSLTQSSNPSPTLADLATNADGSDTIFFFEGKVDAFTFGKGATPLFRLVGFNVRRRVEHAGKVYMVSREIAFYLDLTTGAVLESWLNPLTGKINTVIPVQNDPVNFALPLNAAPQDFGTYWSSRFEVYPSYPLSGQANLYTSGEHFSFFLHKDDWLNGHKNKVVCAWSRTAPWLNWMEMEFEGFLQYHAQCRILASFEELPGWLNELVTSKYEKYRRAPEVFDVNKPNQTSYNQPKTAAN